MTQEELKKCYLVLNSKGKDDKKSSIPLNSFFTITTNSGSKSNSSGGEPSDDNKNPDSWIIWVVLGLLIPLILILILAISWFIIKIIKERNQEDEDDGTKTLVETIHYGSQSGNESSR